MLFQQRIRLRGLPLLPQYDFVIIGAGLSGLTSAYRLKQKGYSVLVLEKSELVGGRLQTIKLDNALSDTGAQFFSESYPMILKLISELKMESDISYASPSLAFLDQDKAVKLNTLNPFSIWTCGLIKFSDYLILVKDMLKVAWKLRGKNFECITNLAFKDEEDAHTYLRKNQSASIDKSFFTPFFSGFNYCSSKEISESMVVKALGHFFARTRIFGLKGGLASLAQALASQLNIKTSVEVVDISQIEEGFKVTTNSESIYCKNLILSTTASVAKKLAGHLCTHEENDALNVDYSSSVHTALLFNKKNFEDDSLYGFMLSEGKSPLFNVMTLEKNKNANASEAQYEMVNVLASLKGYEKLKNNDSIDNDLWNLLPQISPYSKQDLLQSKQTVWDEAIPNCPVGRAHTIAKYRKWITAQRGFYLVGDYMGTPCAEGAVESAEYIAALF